MHDTYPATKDKLSRILPELSPEIAATYETRDLQTTYELGCGDDRYKTPESRAFLIEQGAEPIEPYLRYFGGLAGVTHVLLLTLIAQGREDLVETHFDGSYVDAMKKIKTDVEAANAVTLALHTAENNENNPEHFDPTLETGVGCAYGANIATIGDICVNHKTTALITRQEGAPMYDTGDVSEQIRLANRSFNTQFFPDPKVAGLSRGDYAAVNTLVQVLAGSHATPADTFAVVNFTHDKISNPAKTADTPFYDNDVTAVAEMLIRAYPDFQLDPETLFAVMDQDCRATRTALADGNPAAIKRVRLGNPAEAINYLKNVQKEVTQS